MIYDVAAPLPVDVFTPTESRALLRGQVPGLTEEEADAIGQALEHLPLAITQSAAYLVETGLPVQRYLGLLDDRAGQILAWGAPRTYPVSLAASCQLSFDQLAAEHPAALELMCVAAHLAPDPIPFTLFTTHPDRLPPLLAAAVADPLASFTDLTGVLQRRALVRVEADSLQLHRLVVALLRKRPVTDPDRPAGGAVALQLLAGAVPPDPWNNPASWPAWRQLLPHVLAITDEARNTSADMTVAWLLDRAATYLNRRGEPRPALPLATRAHHLYRTVKGEDHPDTLHSAHNLAIGLVALGEHGQARVLDEDTLTRRLRIVGPDHPDTVNSAHNLAVDLAALGEHEQARVLDEDTLTRRRRILGENHPDTLHSAHNLANRLAALGEHQQARVLDEDTLTRRRRVLGKDHPDTLSSANNLANRLAALGAHEQACVLHEDTLTHRRRIFGKDYPDTLSSAHNLANRLAALGEYEQGCVLHEDTLTRRRRILGEDHPDTLHSANNLAIDLANLGEHEQARVLDEDTLTRRRRILGEDHPDTLSSANNLANRLTALSEHEQARALHEDTLTRRRRILGEDHPDTLHSAHNLAIDLTNLGEHEQGRRLHEWIRYQCGA
ncbi:MAG: FxSxx-COOH system tetratricopeptide repeat protein [Pseudonocardiaceae bacterium]